MSPDASAVADVSIRLFGPPMIERDGAVVGVDTRKAIALLAYLVVTGRPQPRESLTELLWPDQEPAKARGALRRTLSVLNSALGGRGLRIDRRQVVFVPDEADVDVAGFATLARASDEPSLEAAVRMYRGDFLAGFGLRDAPAFDDWQLANSDAFRRDLAGALERLASAARARGDLKEAIARARAWCDLDPLSEAAHRRVMELSAEDGDRAGALRQYRECVAVLERELGVEPLEETTALYESIREDRAPRAVAARVQPRVMAEAPLVGRDAELGAIAGAYASIGADGRFVVVGGEPGIGKTRLAAELVASARERGAVVLTARCHADEENLAFGTTIELLRGARGAGLSSAPPGAVAEAARLVPDLDPDAAAEVPRSPLDSPAARRRLFDGVCDVIAAACAGPRRSGTEPLPGIVFVDDAHWMDESSRDVLAFLARRLRHRPLLIVVTWRTEEVPPAHPLRRVLTDANRAGLGLGVTLGRLSRDDVAALVDATGARGTGRADGDLVTTLFEESAGVPFFLVEYLSALGTSDEAVPAGVRDLLSARVAGLGGTAAQVLTAAAVIGRSFDADVVREASGRSPDEVAGALQELVGAGLIVESDGSYDFSHPKLREHVYDAATHARRRLLHGRTADAFVRIARRRPEAAAVAAQHLERAGRHEDAATQFRAAGDHARGVFANAEALSHYRSALGLGAAGDGASGLHEAIGDLLTLAGRYREALASYETAAALGAPMYEVERKLGAVHHRLGDLEAADAHYAEALAAAAGSAHRARVLAERSLNAHRAGRAGDAGALADEALAAAAEQDDRRALAQAHNIAGVVASGGGRADDARKHLESSLALAEELGDPDAAAAALNNLAQAVAAAGDAEGALVYGERALELATRVGDRHRQAALHSNLADVLRAAGRVDDANEHLKASAALFSEVGETDELLPGIWKLVEW